MWNSLRMSGRKQSKMNRHQVSFMDIHIGTEALSRELDRRLSQHGFGIFVSKHEALGVINEEVHELHDAVKGNNSDEVAAELLDVAVAALFGYISVKTQKMDW